MFVYHFQVHCFMPMSYKSNLALTNVDMYPTDLQRFHSPVALIGYTDCSEAVRFIHGYSGGRVQFQVVSQKQRRKSQSCCCRKFLCMCMFNFLLGAHGFPRLLPVEPGHITDTCQDIYTQYSSEHPGWLFRALPGSNPAMW